jgi:hypothetical protein
MDRQAHARDQYINSFMQQVNINTTSLIMVGNVLHDADSCCTTLFRGNGLPSSPMTCICFFAVSFMAEVSCRLCFLAEDGAEVLAEL